MPFIPSEDDIQRAVDTIGHDLTATLGHDDALLRGVRHEAELLASWLPGTLIASDMDAAGHDFLERVASEVQQWVHDTFRDTTWPACPRHPRHPMWLDPEDDPLKWRCPEDGIAVAPLGALG